MSNLNSTTRTVLFALGLLSLLGVAAAGYLATQEQYTIYVDGEPTMVTGRFQTVAEALEAAGVEVGPHDSVRPAPSDPVLPDEAIMLQRAKEVTVRTEVGTDVLFTHQPALGAFLREADISVQRTDQIFADERRVAFNALDETPLPDVVEVGRFTTVTIHDGQERQTLRTAAQTVGGALQEANVTLYAADGVEPSLGSWLSPGMHIQVRRSMPLTISVDGRLIQTRSHHTNALDVLAEAGIGLVGQDYVRPGPETTLQPNDIIEVVRVTEDFQVKDEPIPFETRWQATDQLEIDSRALLQQGVPGVLRRRIRVRYENGAAVSETPAGKWVAREPVDEIMGYGTKIVVRSVQAPGGAYEFWRKVRMRVTSYTAASAGKPPDHPTYGITASGLEAGTGVVAVDPDVVPFETWVYVPGYGTGFAGDTGGGVNGRWIDLGYDEDEYRSWSGYVDVYYLTPAPPADEINFLIPTWLP